MFRRKPIVIPDEPHLVNGDKELFLDALKKATRYLEYGGGGSTIMAARQGIETVCIESDQRFAREIRKRIDSVPHRVSVHYADIGPTGRWGRPIPILAMPRFRRRYPHYVYAPDRFAGNGFFDLVLIDGRFRVACALYAIRRAVQAEVSCLICFDDYLLREKYQVLAQYCEPEVIGANMALFRPLQSGMIRMPDDEDVWAYCKLQR